MRRDPDYGPTFTFYRGFTIKRDFVSNIGVRGGGAWTVEWHRSYSQEPYRSVSPALVRKAKEEIDALLDRGQP